MASLYLKSFTLRQQRVLQTTFAGDAIRDKRLLNKLAIMGYVKLHKDTGKTIRISSNVYMKAWYLSSAKPFEVEGAGAFHVQYYSGCPYPYVVKTDKTGSFSTTKATSNNKSTR